MYILAPLGILAIFLWFIGCGIVGVVFIVMLIREIRMKRKYGDDRSKWPKSR